MSKATCSQYVAVALFLIMASISAQAALTVMTNFEGASARVLALDPATQTIRIVPAGNPGRGWPCWWYLRLNGVDVDRPLVLQVVANTSAISS